MWSKWSQQPCIIYRYRYLSRRKIRPTQIWQLVLCLKRSLKVHLKTRYCFLRFSSAWLILSLIKRRAQYIITGCNPLVIFPREIFIAPSSSCLRCYWAELDRWVLCDRPRGDTRHFSIKRITLLGDRFSRQKPSMELETGDFNLLWNV